MVSNSRNVARTRNVDDVWEAGMPDEDQHDCETSLVCSGRPCIITGFYTIDENGYKIRSDIQRNSSGGQNQLNISNTRCNGCGNARIQNQQQGNQVNQTQRGNQIKEEIK